MMKKFGKMKMIKKTVVSLGVVIVALLIGCGKSNEGVVRIAYFPNITHSQALVMKNQGSLEQALGEAHEVEWVSFNAGPAEVEAIFAGEIDMGYIGPIPAISANVQSQGDVQIIAGAADAGAVLAVRSDAGIDNAGDLDGKTVAIPQLGNTQHLSLLNLLTENGLQVSDKGGSVKVVAAANADIVNLMQQGNIDAALVPEPWGTILEEQVDAEILLDYDEVWLDGNYPVAVVIANKDFLEENAEVVEEFLRLHQEATLYINENKKEAAAIVNQEIAAVTGKAIDETILDKAFSRVIVTDVLAEDALWAFAQIDLNEGFITKLPDDSLIRP
ncbi:MAG: aliphatic sulfonate ABC transporter substrate-binding protein [Lachnospiraceae bacterium]|jgi:NitT/TauT family transport system substrate-binding protein|nr:aliphatic sulfonate ABC transporter substrate-binding protein [Lachnospiraceae bacterium]